MRSIAFSMLERIPLRLFSHGVLCDIIIFIINRFTLQRRNSAMKEVLVSSMGSIVLDMVCSALDWML